MCEAEFSLKGSESNSRSDESRVITFLAISIDPNVTQRKGLVPIMMAAEAMTKAVA